VVEFGVDVNQTHRDGRTVLRFAASKGNLELVRLLVNELGADVNLAGHDGGKPLLAAAFFKYEKITKLLLKAGADAQAPMILNGMSVTAASGAAAGGASAELTNYLEAKTHCSNSGCGGAGIWKCTGCKQARYCGQACQLAHWPAHKARCKAHQTKVGSDT
jgi:ankyrin repeat protein